MRTLRWLPILIVGGLTLVTASLPRSAGATEKPRDPRQRPRVGLCLAGGGARGGAHIGVLRVLEELRIPVDCIAGTSIGSIIGGLYASGYSPAAMDSALVSLDWGRVFTDEPPRWQLGYRRLEEDHWPRFGLEFGVGGGGLRTRTGVIAGQNLNFLLRRLTLHTHGAGHFDDLAIPYRAIAADLADGSMVVLERGGLADAMRASMAIPGAFTPHEIDGRLLVDGGFVRNMPYDIVKAMGADVVIVIDVGTPVGEMTPGASFLSVAMRAGMLASKANVAASRAQIGDRDVLLLPDLTGISTLSFGNMAAAVERGETVARLHTDALRRFSVSEDEYAAWVAHHRAGRRAPAVTVADVLVCACDRVDPRRVHRCVTTTPGEPLDLAALQDELMRIYRLGEYEAVDYRLLEREDGVGSDLVIETHEKSWGPQYLRFGLALADDLDGDATFRLALYHRLAAIGSRGAEWRNTLAIGEELRIATEFYQPLDYTGRWFVAPSALYSKYDRKLFVSRKISFLENVRHWRAGLDLGWNPATWSELRVGAFVGWAETSFDEFGDLIRDDDRDVGWAASYGADRLDRASFPRSGWLARASAVTSQVGLGADREYDRAALELRGAATAGRTTFIARAEAGSSFASELPVHQAFDLGGFARLSGLEVGAMPGDDLGLLVLGGYHQLTSLGAPLGGAVFLGLLGELGATWFHEDTPSTADLVPGGAAFLGAETFMGPAALGYGLAEGGRDKVFLYLGHVY